MTAPAPGAWAAWDPEPDDPAAPPRATHFRNLPQFVGWLTHTYRRRVIDGRGQTWCPDWWKHPEAIDVLDGLWRSWEHLRLPENAATGKADWWKDYAYPLLRELTAEDGPLLGCSVNGGHAKRPLAPLTVTPPEPGMFTDGDV